MREARAAPAAAPRSPWGADAGVRERLGDQHADVLVVQRVDDLAAAALVDDEAEVAQHAQLLRDGRLLHLDRERERAAPSRAGAQPAEDADAARRCERLHRLGDRAGGAASRWARSTSCPRLMRISLHERTCGCGVRRPLAAAAPERSGRGRDPFLRQAPGVPEGTPRSRPSRPGSAPMRERPRRRGARTTGARTRRRGRHIGRSAVWNDHPTWEHERRPRAHAHRRATLPAAGRRRNREAPPFRSGSYVAAQQHREARGHRRRAAGRRLDRQACRRAARPARASPRSRSRSSAAGVEAAGRRRGP